MILLLIRYVFGQVVTSQLTDAAREIDILQKASGGPNILQLIESIDTDQV